MTSFMRQTTMGIRRSVQWRQQRRAYLISVTQSGPRAYVPCFYGHSPCLVCERHSITSARVWQPWHQACVRLYLLASLFHVRAAEIRRMADIRRITDIRRRMAEIRRMADIRRLRYPWNKAYNVDVPLYIMGVLVSKNPPDADA